MGLSSKKFNNNKWYEGEITGYYNKEKYNEVLYNNSDTEEYTQDETKSLYKHNQAYSKPVRNTQRAPLTLLSPNAHAL